MRDRGPRSRSRPATSPLSPGRSRRRETSSSGSRGTRVPASRRLHPRLRHHRRHRRPRRHRPRPRRWPGSRRPPRSCAPTGRSGSRCSAGPCASRAVVGCSDCGALPRSAPSRGRNAGAFMSLGRVRYSIAKGRRATEILTVSRRGQARSGTGGARSRGAARTHQAEQRVPGRRAPSMRLLAPWRPGESEPGRPRRGGPCRQSALGFGPAESQPDDAARRRSSAGRAPPW